MKTSVLLAFGASMALAGAAPAPSAATTPEPKASPALRTNIDALSAGEVKQAIELLKSHSLGALNEEAISRATLEGLLQRLAPGAAIVLKEQEPVASPFKSEALNETAYLRLGSLENIAALDAALKELEASGGVDSLILDLRATPASNDLVKAAEVAMRFVPRGKPLFTVRRPSKEQAFVSTTDPLFQKLLVVLVSEETAGAAEILAATLREQARAMLIGTQTKGQGAELADFPLGEGKLLRVAVAQVALPSGKSFYPNGVKVDLPVNVPAETRRELLRLQLEDGVGKYVFESERPKRNEAALVAGTNPEFDAAQAAQRKANGARATLRDLEVQRALDLITTIGVYESKRSQE